MRLQGDTFLNLPHREDDLLMTVIPAQAGIQSRFGCYMPRRRSKIPRVLACAGTTEGAPDSLRRSTMI